MHWHDEVAAKLGLKWKRDYLKAALLRQKARDDLRHQVAYYRREASQKVALQLRIVAQSSIGLLEQNPGLGSPTLRKELEIDNLRTWRLTGFPLLWMYIEHPSHLDFVRLLGQQDIVAILENEFSYYKSDRWPTYQRSQVSMTA